MFTASKPWMPGVIETSQNCHKNNILWERWKTRLHISIGFLDKRRGITNKSRLCFQNCMWQIFIWWSKTYLLTFHSNLNLTFFSETDFFRYSEATHSYLLFTSLKGTDYTVPVKQIREKASNNFSAMLRFSDGGVLAFFRS